MRHLMCKPTAALGVSILHAAGLCITGFAAKKTKLEKFDSREEADHACLLCYKWDLDNADNMPRYFYTREEAEAELAEWLAEQK